MGEEGAAVDKNNLAIDKVVSRQHKGKRTHILVSSALPSGNREYGRIGALFAAKGGKTKRRDALSCPGMKHHVGFVASNCARDKLTFR
jgi:hypothetical protein